MKKGLYWTLVRTGIRTNKKMYFPYILTCMGMVMMCYIISFLGESPTFISIPGGTTMQGFLQIGFGVLCVFSLLFLFYTNSFLIRRRKKEFGLYHVLGLGKKHLACVLFLETVAIAGITILGGLFFGILFSKLAELCMIKVLGETGAFVFTIELHSLYQTVILFAIIFAILFLNTLRQIHLANPIQLLHSENTGEKPPKANWVVAILGIGILGAAYYLAVTIADPVTALTLFFFAAVMVVIGTYLLFIAGSVTLCRTLQKNKRYYYKTNHFVSVSSMAYRMKRNGAGLASICILCTMVLVMVSSTVCLYIGAEDSLRNRYPRNIQLDAAVSDVALLSGEQTEQTQELVQQVVEEHETEQERILQYRVASCIGMIQDEQIIINESIDNSHLEVMPDIRQVYIVPLSDYNRLTGEEETLSQGEALLYTTEKTGYSASTIQLGDSQPLTVKKQVDTFDDNRVDDVQVIPSIYLFVSDLDAVIEPLKGYGTEEGGQELITLHWYYGFDLPCDDETQIQIQDQIAQEISNWEQQSKEFEQFHVLLEGVAKERASFYGIYGGLFFLGILLGIVFIVAAVLIIYYKQISEGYEDQSRFDIMQKVGMTKKEIKKSINSQILTVFFLPLLTAGVHLAFAFPLIRKLLLVFNLTNFPLLVIVTVCCYLVFALFYIIVYRVTSRSYYSIVSGLRIEYE